MYIYVYYDIAARMVGKSAGNCLQVGSLTFDLDFIRNRHFHNALSTLAYIGRGLMPTVHMGQHNMHITESS